MSFWSDLLRALKPKPKAPQAKPAPKPTPAPASAKRTLLLIPASTLLNAALPAGYWRELGFTGLVVLLDGDAWSLYSPALDAGALLTHCQAIRSAAGDLELFFAFWSTNPIGPSKFLVGWDDDANWAVFDRNLRALAAAAAAVKAAGVMMDAEWYPVSGTDQSPVAWPASPLVEQRAHQYAAALLSAAPAGRPPLVLGHYVTFQIEDRLPAYPLFWRTVEAAAPGSLMLTDDDFTYGDLAFAAKRQAVRAALGCESLAGLEPKTENLASGDFARRLAMARAGSPAGVWVFPWPPDLISNPAAVEVAQLRAALGASK